MTLIALGAALLGLAPAPACAADKVTVTLWTWRPDASVVRDMVAVIERTHPDIELRAVVQTEAAYFAALRQAAAAGTLPDIVGLPAGAETQRLRGQLQDVSTPASDVLGKDWRKHFVPGVLAEAALGNPKGDHSLYILPMSAEVLGLWSDRRAFAAAGLSRPPGSLDDMAADAARLRAAGLTPFALGGTSDQAVIGLFLQIVAQTDPVDLGAAEAGQPVWSRPGIVHAATAWQLLFATVVGPQALSTDPQAAAGQFAQGRAGISPQGSRWLHQARAAETPDGAALADFQPFAFPALGAAGHPSPPLGGVDVGWAITQAASGSPDVEQASHIVLHDLVAGVGAAVAVDALAGLPAYTDLPPPGTLPDGLRQLYDGFRAQLGAARPHVIGEPAVHDALATQLRAVAAGHVEPGAALAAVDSVAREQAMLAR